MADPTQPEPQKIDPTRPGSKFFDPDPSLDNTVMECWEGCRKGNGLW